MLNKLICTNLSYCNCHYSRNIGVSGFSFYQFLCVHINTCKPIYKHTADAIHIPANGFTQSQ